MASVPPNPRQIVACSDRSDLLYCGLFPGPQYPGCVRNETHPVRIECTERRNVKIRRRHLVYYVRCCQTVPLFDGHKSKESTNHHQTIKRIEMADLSNQKSEGQSRKIIKSTAMAAEPARWSVTPP
jgi:hypothetical protein